MKMNIESKLNYPIQRLNVIYLKNNDSNNITQRNMNSYLFKNNLYNVYTKYILDDSKDYIKLSNVETDNINNRITQLEQEYINNDMNNNNIIDNIEDKKKLYLKYINAYTKTRNSTIVTLLNKDKRYLEPKEKKIIYYYKYIKKIPQKLELQSNIYNMRKDEINNILKEELKMKEFITNPLRYINYKLNDINYISQMKDNENNNFLSWLLKKKHPKITLIKLLKDKEFYYSINNKTLYSLENGLPGVKDLYTISSILKTYTNDNDMMNNIFTIKRAGDYLQIDYCEKNNYIFISNDSMSASFCYLKNCEFIGPFGHYGLFIKKETNNDKYCKEKNDDTKKHTYTINDIKNEKKDEEEYIKSLHDFYDNPKQKEEIQLKKNDNNKSFIPMDSLIELNEIDTLLGSIKSDMYYVYQNKDIEMKDIEMKD
jgi:hypothetical protein